MMRSIWILATLAAILLEVQPAPSKDKPSVMIGIRGSTTPQPTTSTTEAELSSTTPHHKTGEKLAYPDKPHTNVKKPIAEKHHGTKPSWDKIDGQKKPLISERPTEILKRGMEKHEKVSPEKRLEVASEESVANSSKPMTEEQTFYWGIDAQSPPSDQKITYPTSSEAPVSTSTEEPHISTEEEKEEEKPNKETTQVSTVAPCAKDSVTDVYDNSQHGKDNYRLHVKGFTVLVAPSDTVLGAAMLMSDAALADSKNSLHDNKVHAARSQESKHQFSKLLHLLQKLKGGDRR